jgi:glycosyltransferase involved in cell wall biosynthesis
MRVLWFNHRDPLHPEAGGAEVRIHEIGKRLVQNGWQVKLICEKWRGAERSVILDGVEIVRIGGKYSLHLSVPFLLNASNGYDVIIDDVAHAVPWFSPIFTNKPVIGQVHHAHQEALNLELAPPLARLVGMSESAIKYFYEMLIAVSDSTKRDLIQKFGIPAERIEVVPNGVDSDFYRPMSKSLEPTVLWVGRVKRYKRIEHVLSAFRFVEKTLPDAKLFVVGGGRYIETLKSYSERLGLSNVIFTGRVNQKEKARLMAYSWVVVSSSLVEGWGLTITESAACATPAVVYNVPGLRDSVNDGVTGLIVEDGNPAAMFEALIKVLQDEELRSNLSKKAFDRARQFSWHRSAQDFTRILERIVGER